MAVSGNSALPEHWTELNAARKQRQLCAADVEAIKKSCEADHGTKHVAECKECFSKVMDRMFGRFKDSQDHEWFSERRAVVFGLENLFSEAKERKRDLKDIEEHIGSEKEAWYRWVLRRHPEFLAAGGSGVDQDEVRGTLDDPDKSREELVAMVGQAVGMSEDWSSNVDSFVEKAAAAKGDVPTLKKLYIEEFFKDRSTGETLEDAQKYLEMYEANPDAGMEGIIDQILTLNKEAKSSQAQRNTHQKRLDELRRAKTAFEQNKAQAKGQQQGAQASKVDDRYYSLPPCSVCQGVVDSNDVSSCEICQMVSQMGGEKPMTLYCSEKCNEKGFADHVEQEHDCEAGDKCVQETDEDVAMEDESTGPVACNECLDQKQATLFCSPRCAQENLAAHRKDKHEADTPSGGVQELVSPLAQMVAMTLTEDKTGLQFKS